MKTFATNDQNKRNRSQSETLDSCFRRNDTRFFLFITVSSLIFYASTLHASEPVRHALSVSLQPAAHRIAVTDAITVPGGRRELRFVLHAGLQPVSPDPKVSIRKAGTAQGPVPHEAFVVTLPQGKTTFTLRYGGAIYHPVEPVGKEQARGFGQTAGTITDEIVYLAGSSVWYPQFGSEFVTFTLTAGLPAK